MEEEENRNSAVPVTLAPSSLKSSSSLDVSKKDRADRKEGSANLQECKLYIRAPTSKDLFIEFVSTTIQNLSRAVKFNFEFPPDSKGHQVWYLFDASKFPKPYSVAFSFLEPKAACIMDLSPFPVGLLKCPKRVSLSFVSNNPIFKNIKIVKAYPNTVQPFIHLAKARALTFDYESTCFATSFKGLGATYVYQSASGETVISVEERINLLSRQIENLLGISPASGDCSDDSLKSKLSREVSDHLEVEEQVEKRICDLENQILETIYPYDTFLFNM